MIIITGILAVSLVLVVIFFLRHIIHIYDSFRIREWELQERIREPSIEIMPPTLIDAEAVVKENLDYKVAAEFAPDEDEVEMNLVGGIYPDGVPGREGN